MGFLETYFGISRKTRINESASVSQTDHLNVVNELLRQQVELRESNGLLSLKLEDYMWIPVAGWQTDRGFSLGTIQDEADHCRALYAINPLIKKAVTARVGMIHGRGCRILTEGGKGQASVDRELELNHRKIFGPVARARLEAELSSTGNVWVIRERNKTAITVPIHQIQGYISEVDDPTKVLYWHRSYQAQTTNMESGQQETIIVSEYIPTSAVTSPVANIGEVPVRRSARMLHIAANRQEDWILGLPDVFAAKFWTKGHKEMFEAGHEFALAQGQVAAKVTGGSGLGSQLAASRLADEPRRDPDTGEVMGYGGTFVGSNGMDYQLMGKMGSGIDFKSYDRIVGLVAAATGVPAKVLLAESDSDEISLEQTTVDDMKLRQQLWGEFYEDFFDSPVQVVWPRIKQETVYRVQQAIELTNRSNTMTAAEKRLLALESWGLEGSADEVPDIMEHPDVQVYLAKKQIDLEYAPLIAEAEGKSEDELTRKTTNDQGNDQGLGKLSDGEDSHDLRDAGEQEHTR